MRRNPSFQKSAACKWISHALVLAQLKVLKSSQLQIATTTRKIQVASKSRRDSAPIVSNKLRIRPRPSSSRLARPRNQRLKQWKLVFTAILMGHIDAETAWYRIWSRYCRSSNLLSMHLKIWRLSWTSLRKKFTWSICSLHWALAITTQKMKKVILPLAKWSCRFKTKSLSTRLACSKNSKCVRISRTRVRQQASHPSDYHLKRTHRTFSLIISTWMISRPRIAKCTSHSARPPTSTALRTTS